jgi:hypothetical protein
MLGKLTRIALLGGLVLLGSTVLAVSAYAETTAYGTVNFTAIYSLNNMANGNGDLGVDATPPVKDSGPDEIGGGTFLFHAAASKFGVKSSADTDMGKVTAVIEVDAAGRGGNSSIGSDSSAPHIRLRHAYGTVGNLLLGRTWGGLATDFSWFPVTLDPAGPYGASVVYTDPRMAQVRYTVPMGDNKFVISAEANCGIRSILCGENASTLPRLVPAFYMNLGMAKVQVVAAMTSIRVNEARIGADLDGSGETKDDITGSGTAFGVNAAVGFGDGTLKIHFLTGGGGWQQNSAFLGAPWYMEADSTGKVTGIKFNTLTDMTLSYSHKLDDKSNINFTYGSIAAGDDVADSGGTASAANSIHLNYRWAAAPGVTMGVEYATKTMTYEPSGDTGTTSAIVFGTDFNF